MNPLERVILGGRKRNDPYYSSVVLLMHMDGTDGSAALVDEKGTTITVAGQLVQRVANPKYGPASVTTDFTTNDPFWSQVTLLMHCNGANLSQALTDVKAHTVTGHGSLAIDTSDKQFGSGSLSSPGPGTASYFSFAQSTDFNFGTSDFTIEFWLKTTGTPAASQRIFQSRDGDVVPGVYLSWTSATQLQFYASTNGSAFNLGPINFNFSAGTWRHIAVVRFAGYITVFLDGVAQGSFTISGATALYYNSGDTWVWLGQSTPDRSSNAHIDEIRITKGVGRYPGPNTPMTPPVAEFLEQGGGLPGPFFKHPAFNLAAADFTVEFWLYANITPSVTQRGFQTRDGDLYCAIAMNALGDGTWQFGFSSNGTSADLGVITTGVVSNVAWHHFAVTRGSTTVTVWVDGVSAGTVAVSTTALYYNAADYWVWLGQSGPSYRNLDAYLDDVRVTAGVCRYTGTFTPPASAFPNS